MRDRLVDGFLVIVLGACFVIGSLLWLVKPSEPQDSLAERLDDLWSSVKMTGYGFAQLFVNAF